MARIVIAHPEGAVCELLRIVVDLRGHECVSYDDAGIEESDLDALIVDAAWPLGLACAHRLRRSRPDLAIVCVGARSPTQEAKALLPVSYLTMPFHLAELDRALQLALGD